MTTITINERIKAGKIVLELAKILSGSNKGVVIEENTNLEKSISNAKEGDYYDPKFVAMIKNRITKEKFSPITTNSIWESI